MPKTKEDKDNQKLGYAICIVATFAWSIWELLGNPEAGKLGICLAGFFLSWSFEATSQLAKLSAKDE